jgi:hypothetical protein
VASVFNALYVSLTVSNSPILLEMTIDFTATGGGDLFEFSIDNIVVQPVYQPCLYN